MDILEIVSKAKNGDSEAFSKLYKEYYSKIYRYCRINIYNKLAAEDICQETFVKAWKSLPNFKITDEGTFQAYLFKIARNLIIDLSRKKKEVGIEQAEYIESDEDLYESQDRKDRIATVRNALSKLNENERQILILRYFEDLQHAEVAKILGIREGALRVRTARLLKKLREIINI